LPGLRSASAAVALALFCACAAAPAGSYTGFGEPSRVAIRGYNGDAMEPFVTRDGRFLLFNNRNDPRINTNLHYAARVDDVTFEYRGDVKGVNTPALEGVPSMDDAGNFYFISTRSYRETLSTLYRGRFKEGTVSAVELVAGVSLKQAGVVMFDAEISPDGSTLWLVDGAFSGGPIPRRADIAVAVRDGAGFRRLPASAEILKNVNTAALEYAPAISRDGLELFFTRSEATPTIWRAARKRTNDPFALPERVAAITGFVEAPTFSPDGRALYYHKLESGRYVIYRVAR
jgi:hypothetical protein